MNLVIVSVFDRAAQAFAQPQFVAAAGQAIRGFSDQVNGDKSVVSEHPDDFDLYEFGAFDDNAGKFELHGEARLLARGKDVKVSG